MDRPPISIAIHTASRWPPGRVTCRWVESSRRIDPAAEREIDAAWQQAQGRPGLKLFDGPMCRLERWCVERQALVLEISRTSYRIFYGTNMRDRQQRLPADVLANPLGVSCALETAEGSLLLGRRNDRVAYYPARVHPFAGALEPSDQPDVFEEMRRELAEELDLTNAGTKAPGLGEGFSSAGRREPSPQPSSGGNGDLAEMHCLGLVEDRALRQPELVLHAKVRADTALLMQNVDAAEHRGCVLIPAEPAAVERALADAMMTPVAVATLLLWGRERFGEAWFNSARAPITG